MQPRPTRSGAMAEVDRPFFILRAPQSRHTFSLGIVAQSRIAAQNGYSIRNAGANTGSTDRLNVWMRRIQLRPKLSFPARVSSPFLHQLFGAQAPSAPP